METLTSAPDWIAHHARATPDALACHDVASGRILTYAAFGRRVGRLAWHLQRKLNLPAGARVLVLSRNDTDVLEVLFACQRARLIFVPLNWRLAVPELNAIAGDSGAELLIHGEEFTETALKLQEIGSIRDRVAMSGGKDSEYERAIAEATKELAPAGTQSLDDIWSLIYTSGTTGKPKGVQISYRMAVCNAVTLGMSFRVTSESRNLVVLPLFHTGGLNVFANPVFFHGGCNIVAREFDPEQVLVLASKQGGAATHMLGVPTMHAMLMQSPNFAEIAHSSLKHVAVAGAPCPREIVQRYAEHGVDLRQCWGMTEVGPLVLLCPPALSQRKWGACGLPSMFIQARVVDSAGSPVPSGTVGELLVKGPPVTRGYWRRPEADAAAFTEDGWLRTGDAASCDDDGFYYIVDRWKDMYISGGENVYPAEIERVLANHPDVLESAVIGIPDPKWGEVGLAYVVLRTSDDSAAASLRAHCERHLARFKLPKEFAFVPELPHGPSGKVLKNKLREIARNV